MSSPDAYIRRELPSAEVTMPHKAFRYRLYQTKGQAETLAYHLRLHREL